MSKEKLMIMAEYYDIILSLLSPPFNISSIVKLLIIAFCVRNVDLDVFSICRKNDVVDYFLMKSIPKLNSKFMELEDELFVVKFLESSGVIVVSGDCIDYPGRSYYKSENLIINKSLKSKCNYILELNKLGSLELIEEVIRYV